MTYVLPLRLHIKTHRSQVGAYREKILVRVRALDHR